MRAFLFLFCLLISATVNSYAQVGASSICVLPFIDAAATGQLPGIGISRVASSVTCSTNPCSVLAVSGLHLDAKRSTAALVAVNWYAVNEVNSQGYYVQRSFDGIVFHVASPFITAKGVTAGKATYALGDTNRYSGTTFYRIAEVDESGKSTYSNTVAVKGMDEGELIIYPNPATAQCIVQVPQNYMATNVSIRVYTMLGSLVYQKEHLNLTGVSLPITGVSRFGKGSYIVVADNGSKKLYGKLRVL